MTLEDLALAQDAFLQACEDALAEFKATCPDVDVQHIQYNMYPAMDAEGVEVSQFGCSVSAEIEGARITRSI